MNWLILLGAAAGGAFLLHEGAANGIRSPYVPLAGKAPFIQAMSDALRPIAARLSEDSWALVIAHGAFESGWGKSSAMSGWNWFNITAGGQWLGSTQLGPDSDCSSGKCVPITQKWRVYADGTDAIVDYLGFLEALYPTAWQRLVAADAAGFATALGQAGYYTLDIPTYVARYLAVLNSVIAEAERMNS